VGKKVQELTANLGVAGIVEGKLEGDGSTRNRVGAARFRERQWCSGDWSVGRRKEIVQEALAWRCGVDGALGEGAKRGGTSIRQEFRMVAENESAGATFRATRAQEEEEKR
jgi:hypothetical protein